MSIVLYSTHCPKCKVVEKKLDIQHIDYTICDDLELMEAKGFMSAPILEVDGTPLKFREAIDWLKKEQMYAN